jgi:hypothetical protein
MCVGFSCVNATEFCYLGKKNVPQIFNITKVEKKNPEMG